MYIGCDASRLGCPCLCYRLFNSGKASGSTSGKLLSDDQAAVAFIDVMLAGIIMVMF